MRSSKPILFAICFGFIFSVGCAYETVKPGYVGIKVPLYGSKEDKTEYQTVYGRVWYNPWYYDVYMFPTFMQQVVWDKAITEEDKLDASVTFQSEGKSINCDIAFAYTIQENMVTKIFRDQRREIDAITSVYLHSKVRDAFNRHSGNYKVHEIMGIDKEKFLKEVVKDLTDDLNPRGFNIDMVSIVGEMRVDAKVTEAISSTIAQQQKALEADAKVKQSEAEARQAVAIAKGKADAEVAEAEGKAKALLKIAEANAQGNKKLQESLSPELLQYEALQKWDGKLPTMMTNGALPFINLTPDQLKQKANK